MKETMRIYLILRFLSSFGMSVIGATYVIFLQSHGLDLFQVNLVNVACWLTMFVVQVPTGLIADVFGRKRAFLISCAIMSLNGVMYSFSETLIEFMVCEVFAALGITFANAAFDAWVIARLTEYGYTDGKEMIMGRSQLVGSCAGILGVFCGGFLGGWKLEAPWCAMTVAMGVTGIYAAFAMKETRGGDVLQAVQQWQNIKSTFCTSLRYLRNTKDLHFVLVIDSVVVFAVQPFNMYWQPFFKQIFPATWLLGVFDAALSLAAMLGVSMVLRFGQGANVKKSLLRLVTTIGLSMLACSLLTSAALVLLPFLFQNFLRGWYYPIRGAYVQDRLPDAERSTVASMMFMLIALSGTLGLFLSGLIAERFGIPTSWFVSGCCFIFVALYYVRKVKN